MKRIYLMVCLALGFGPLLVHAEEAVLYEIDAKFVACPTNEASTAPFALDRSALPASWKVLSAPRVTTTAGTMAQICILNEPLQYFEKQSDGSFQLRRMSDQDETGITLTIATTPGNSDGNLNLKTKVKFSSVLKREELPGVSLDVGKPTVVSTEQRFNSQLKFGAWLISELSGVVYPGYSSADQEMLLMLRIRRVNPRGQLIDARGQLLAQ